MSRNDSALSGRRGCVASELAEKPASRPAAAADLRPFLRGVSQGRVSEVVCPSVCPSDWDKHETLVVSRCSATTCDERFKMQRRGQDSNLRTSFPVTGLANPRFRPLSHLSQNVSLRTVAARHDPHCPPQHAKTCLEAAHGPWHRVATPRASGIR